MNIISLLILMIAFSLFYIGLISKIDKKNFTNDLLFFLIVGIILLFMLSIFYFYFQDKYLSLILCIILNLNNTLLLRELHYIKKSYFYIMLPYYLYFIYVLFKLI